MKILDIFLFITGAAASSIPVPLIKLYTKSDNILWIFLSILSYLTLIVVYIFILKDRNVTITYAILKVLSIIFTSGLDILIFKSKFSLKTIIGLVLAVISVMLLSIKDID